MNVIESLKYQKEMQIMIKLTQENKQFVAVLKDTGAFILENQY